MINELSVFESLRFYCSLYCFVLFQLQVTLILSAVNVIACLGLGFTKVVLGHKLESRALITDSK